MTRERMRALSGMAAAVVPGAIVVHLVAEALSIGSASLGADFVMRHLYLGGLLVLSSWAFAELAGIGGPHREMLRRTALLRAEFRAIGRTRAHCALLAVANLAFFGLTQVAEGGPILSGNLGVGIVAAIAGSIVAALFVLRFTRRITAAVRAVAIRRNAGRRPLRRRARIIILPARHAGSVYTLIIPNRPPPALSFI